MAFIIVSSYLFAPHFHSFPSSVSVPTSSLSSLPSLILLPFFLPPLPFSFLSSICYLFAPPPSSIISPFSHPFPPLPPLPPPIFLSLPLTLCLLPPLLSSFSLHPPLPRIGPFPSHSSSSCSLFVPTSFPFSPLFSPPSLPPSQTLESVAYEVSLNLNQECEYTTRLVLILMSTVAKIASRCQDLIPRALLCLNKIVQLSSVRHLACPLHMYMYQLATSHVHVPTAHFTCTCTNWPLHMYIYTTVHSALTDYFMVELYCGSIHELLFTKIFIVEHFCGSVLYYPRNIIHKKFRSQTYTWQRHFHELFFTKESDQAIHEKARIKINLLYI